MAERDRLEGLRPLAEEAFSGLHADEILRRRILRAAKEPAPERNRMPVFRFIPAVCAVLLLAVGLIAFRMRKPAGQSFTEMQELNKLEDRAVGPQGAVAAPTATGMPMVTEMPLVARNGEDLSLMADGEMNMAFAAAGEELEETEEDVFYADATMAYGDMDAGRDPKIAEIEEIAAGSVPAAGSMMKSASLSGVEVHNAVSRGDSLFANGSPEIPVLCLNGAVYRLLKEPGALAGGLLDGQIGTVRTETEHPSLATKQELASGLSNCCGIGSAVYAITSLSKSTAVAAEVNGRMRLFQRISYAGLGSAAPLSESLALSGKLKEMTLSGVGTLSGEAAERAFKLLLSSAERIAKEAEPGAGTLTFVLKNGLRLQMTVSGETLIACGAWQCPAFFDAFRQAL